jgi:hypothetical protein
MEIKPNTGFNSAKVGLLVNCRIVFDQFYPFRAPSIKFTNKKGLDEEQFEAILVRMT